MSASSDRNLLLGILALQMDFVTREQLVAAMHAWVLAKSKPLDQVLFDQGALKNDTRALLTALVAKHLELHAGDAQQSLAAVSSVGSLREELKSLADPDVEASLSIAGKARDPDATMSWSVGAATSAGQRFRILRPHARGGLGQVSVALDNELSREVALKEILTDHADDPVSRSRFMLEAEITGGLEHPGIVPVYGLGQYADGRPFYAMRFIRGDSLKEAIDRIHKDGKPDFHGVAFRQLLGRFIDVCNAVAYAHSRGVLHRDLKPGNIMLGKYGETLVVDWGLAKAQGRTMGSSDDDEKSLKPRIASGSSATLVGSALGTPGFISPEQASGRLDELGSETDVYSLGASLYTALTGKPPFNSSEERDLAATLRNVQAGIFPIPRHLNSSIPAALQAICLKAMALAPKDRYSTCSGLADDLERYLADEPVAAYAEPALSKVRRWSRKHPRSVASLAASVLVGLISAIVLAGVVNAARNTALAQVRQLAIAKSEAEEKRKEADTARREAEMARKRAEVLSNYITNILQSPDPLRDGRSITVAELLDRAQDDLNDRQFDPLTASMILASIGESYRGLGLYENSVGPLSKALELRKQVPNADASDVLTAQNNLAMAFQQAGQAPKAIPLLQQNLKRRMETLGGRHPETLSAMNNLALVYQDVGRLTDALPMFEQTYERRREVLGGRHHDTLTALHNLACACQNAGELRRAETLFNKCLSELQNTPQDQELGLWVREALAMNYLLRGAAREAVNLYEDCLKIRRAEYGDDHPLTLATMGNLGASLLRDQRPREALALMEECLKRTEAKKGANHPDTQLLRDNVAVISNKLEGTPAERDDR
jgi:serine/threonine protein kinase